LPVPGIEATEPENLRMVKSEGSRVQPTFWIYQLCRAERGKNGPGALALCVVLCIGLIGLSSAGWAQGTSEFTLSAPTIDPNAIAPGGVASIPVTVGAVGGFSGSVALTCQITSNQTTITSPPACTVSPASVTPPATATATVTTTVTTTPVRYGVTITGTTATPTTYSTQPLGLTVLAVTPQFTITVQTAVAPSSVPAGNGAEGVVSVNPINGYISPAGGITLYCSSITPLVTIAPVCSFSYATGQTLKVSGNPVTSTLTISTFGPIATGALAHARKFYALWLPVPLLGFLGIGAAVSGKRSRKVFGMLALIVMSGSLLLLPSCSGANTVSNTTPNGVTPANTYTFTIVGVDSDGVVSSNTGTNNTATTVTLTVTAPAPH
jgi:hypothetical protein